MKNITKIGYIVLIIIVVILSLTIYTNASKADNETQKEKIFAEIKFMETKLASLLNTMNHIEARNYSVVTSELSKATTEKSNSDNNSSKSSSGGSGGESSGGGNSSGGSGSSSGESSSGGGSSSGGDSSEQQDSSDSSSQENQNKKFDLKASGVLTNTDDINWDNVKGEIESIYTSIPSITIDLYQSNINQEDILAFNTEFDKLTGVVKDEKKEETLAELIKVYEYLPKFLHGSEQEELYTTLIETKYNILKGYAKLDGGNWQEISNDTQNAISVYSKLLTNTDIDARKQYNISKTYIMMNELQNAVNLQDTSVFLIKYKNLLEEINNI